LDAGSAGELVKTIVEAGESYGTGTELAGQVINVEFVSANPTGPLHIGHTRWAALGDSLVRVLRAAGASVTSEFYINDQGVQMDKFGLSVIAAAEGSEPPEDGYQGEYMAEDLATRVLERVPDLLDMPEPTRTDTARDQAYELQLGDIKDSLCALQRGL
jgi:arginyl-tRNA synthetase